MSEKLDLSKILHMAEQNRKKASQDANIKRYSTQLPPAKRESGVSSSGVARFLARKQEEEAKKKLAAETMRENLVALRQQEKGANRRVRSMLQMTKSADKSVIEGEVTAAPQNVHQVQPDDDDYGYSSQESNKIFEKLLKKYEQMPLKDPFAKRKKKTVPTKLQPLVPDKERVRDEPEAPSSSSKSGASHHHDRKSESSEMPSKPSAPPRPPSLSFQDLMKQAEENRKLAQENKAEVIEFLMKPKVKKSDAKEFEFDRPMTAKEKREFIRERESSLRRGNRTSTVTSADEGVNTASEDSSSAKEQLIKSGTSSKGNGMTKGEAGKQKPPPKDDPPTPRPTVGGKQPVMFRPPPPPTDDEFDPTIGRGKVPSLPELKRAPQLPPRKTPLPPGPSMSPAVSIVTAFERPAPVPSSSSLVSGKKETAASRDRPSSSSRLPPPAGVVRRPSLSDKSSAPARCRSPEASRVREPSSSRVAPPPPRPKGPAGELSSSKDRERSPPPKPKKKAPFHLNPYMDTALPPPRKKHRRQFRDDEDDDGSDLDDFIVDDEDEELDVSGAIQSLFGSRYKRAPVYDESDDDDNMESSYLQCEKEEYISKRAGLLEDLKDIQREKKLKQKLKARKR